MTNPHQTNSVEEVVEDFVNWYFGKREHWSTHDETRAKLMAEKLTTLVEQARGEGEMLWLEAIDHLPLVTKLEIQRRLSAARTISSDSKNV